MTSEAAPMANVGTVERVATAAAGSALIAWGLRRRGWLGSAAAGLGGYMFWRGATGRCCAYSAAGVNTARNYTGLHAECQAVIDRPAAELYRFWRDFENLPRFMDHLESVWATDDTHSHWVAKGPLGAKVEWDAEIIHEIPDELIAWRSLDGADVQSVGSVGFAPSENGAGTLVRVVMQYDPPGGQFGAAAAKLLGADPTSALERDLSRLREMMESELNERSKAMSEKKRAKKDGHNTDKDRAAMRENVKQRKETAATSRAGQSPNDTDQPDYTPYKRGSEEDRTMRQGNNSV